MHSSARLFNCARCRRQAVICRHCDRGNQYCDSLCARTARSEAQRLAGRRYQLGRQGRFAHASRQQRYRLRQQQKVTHQGSTPIACDDLLICSTGRSPSASPHRPANEQSQIICHFCHRRAVKFLRLDFLRRP